MVARATALVWLAVQGIAALPVTEHSCAPFFFQKVKTEGKVETSIVRIRCDESPPFDGTCDPTFTERVYYRTISGYSCLLEYLTRPTPLLEELECSKDHNYNEYFEKLGLKPTSAGWVLQDPDAGVLLQVRPNAPYRYALEYCNDYFGKLGYKFVSGPPTAFDPYYLSGLGGAAWEGSNSTHHVWYSVVAKDFGHSACWISDDSRRYMPPFKEMFDGPGAAIGGNKASCPAGQKKVGDTCTASKSL